MNSTRSEPSSRPGTGHADALPSNTDDALASHADDADRADSVDHGRVGYGSYARYTPLALALILVASLVAIGVARSGDDPADDAPVSRAGAMLGMPAPDATLTLLDGSAIRLDGLRGQVVVLNFWAIWCEPCKDEMPLFQDLTMAGPVDGSPFTIVGVGVKAGNTPEDLRSYAQSLGITYATAYDGGGDSALVGPVESSFGTADLLPLTFIIAPDGVIHHVQVGQYQDAADLTDDIREAAESTAA